MRSKTPSVGGGGGELKCRAVKVSLNLQDKQQQRR